MERWDYNQIHRFQNIFSNFLLFPNTLLGAVKVNEEVERITQWVVFSPSVYTMYASIVKNKRKNNMCSTTPQNKNRAKIIVRNYSGKTI